MKIDDHKQEDGSYIDPSGCIWTDAEDFIQGHVLGFCLCGNPRENLTYVRDCLRSIQELEHAWRNVGCDSAEWGKWYKEWSKRRSNLMGNAEYFTLYTLAEKELTEHGGNVCGGWLSEKGSDLLSDLEELLK